jgi:predicted permease
MGIRSWLKRRRLDLDDEDFREEIRANLAIAAEERVSDGEDAQEAHYAALREFGNVTLATEAARRVWTPRWLEGLRDLASDVRYAARSLSRHPGFTITVILVLALGIGLNAAVFTMVKALALSPVAGVERSASLAVLVGRTESGRSTSISYPDYRHVRDHDRAFSGMFGTTVATVGLGRGRDSRPIWAELVTGNYFEVLGVGAHLGRTLIPPDEDAPGRHPVVVLSDGLWRRDFGADPAIVGTTIEINGRPLTVVGVVDSAFHGTTVVYDVEAFIPITMAPDLGFSFGSRERTPSGILSDPAAGLFYPYGFLKPGVARDEAGAAVNAIWSARPAERTAAGATQRLEIVPFWQMPHGALTYMLPSLVVLCAMGLLVLAITCANIAGLVLVRGLTRRGEIGVRLALGAARGRILRLLMVEHLVLVVPGAVLGVLLAGQGLPVLVAYAEALAAPQRIFFNIEIDGLVLAFTALTAGGCALLFGLAPSLQTTRIDLIRVVNEDASPRAASRGRMRTFLVVSQVAVSCLLLVGAGLVTRSLEAARTADPGVEVDPVVSVSLDLKQNGYDMAKGRRLFADLLDSLRADPAFASVTLAAEEPLTLLDTRAVPVEIAGDDPRHGEDLAFLSNVVSTGYFSTLRIPLLAGRGFDDGDEQESQPVAIVNATLASRFHGTPASAIGRRIRVNGDWRTIVGVAADVKYLRIDEAPRPYIYLPLQQSYRPRMILHTAVAPGRRVDAGLVARARAHVARLDPDLPVLYARPLAQRLEGALIFYHLTATMLTLFGVAGLALAALGIHGLVSYVVKGSTHEIGIRMALGATAPAVVRGFVVEGVRLGALGATLGIVAALNLGTLLRSVLFGVSPTDIGALAQALLIVLGGVLVATLVPACRAARIDPLAALRHS